MSYVEKKNKYFFFSKNSGSFSLRLWLLTSSCCVLLLHYICRCESSSSECARANVQRSGLFCWLVGSSCRIELINIFYGFIKETKKVVDHTHHDAIKNVLFFFLIFGFVRVFSLFFFLFEETLEILKFFLNLLFHKKVELIWTLVFYLQWIYLKDCPFKSVQIFFECSKLLGGRSIWLISFNRILKVTKKIHFVSKRFSNT